MLFTFELLTFMLVVVLTTVAALQAPPSRIHKTANCYCERCQSLQLENGKPMQAKEIDRLSFFNRVISKSLGIILVVGSGSPAPSKAIEFVPASPSFQGTYQDAKEILYSQRLALDNIGDVISNGNMEEAGFKIMQLSAQTNTAGKIILDSFQEKSFGNGINILRFLSCQKKFATLLDYCDLCGLSLQKALTGKLGVTAAAQLRLGSVVEETKNAFDDLLGEIKIFEKSQMQ